MIIRKVGIQDVQEIKRIADSLVVTSEREDRTSGFYDYCLTSEQYERRSNSNLFLVANRDSELEAFCMAYDSKFIRRLMEEEPRLREELVFDYLSRLSQDYIYLDQLAAKKPGSFTGSIAVCNLFNELRELAKNKEFMLGIIPHSPWKNRQSIRFANRQGFKLVDKIGSKEKILFGVYRLDLV